MSDVLQFIKEALECSVYLSPRDAGLTVAELQEAAKAAGYRTGETSDGIFRLCRFVGDRCLPKDDLIFTFGGGSVDFSERFDPDFRNREAFEFVRQELRDAARDVGAEHAAFPRDVLVERGAARGHDRHAVEVAVTVTVLAGVLAEKEGVVSRGNDSYALPSEQAGQDYRFPPRVRPTLLRVHGIVRDVVARRSAGKPPAASPFEAFEPCLDALGHGSFRTWWTQALRELRLAGPMQPTTAIVLAACLAEGALSFVVARAQKHRLMARLDAAKPRQWAMGDLVEGAKSDTPGVEPILDEQTCIRALRLDGARKRIHAGFLLDAAAAGPGPELKAEDVRDAVQAAEAVVRRTVEWLEKHP